MNQIIKLSNESNKLIPEATDRETTLFIVVVPAYTAIVVIQAGAPGTACTALRRTPPAKVEINGEECSNDVAVAARKT